MALSFESSFWLNLHNFLFKEAKRRAGIDDDSPGARGNLYANIAGARPLGAREAQDWQQALQFYQTRVLTDRLQGRDSIVITVNDRLALTGPAADLQSSAVDPELVGHLENVARIYREVWWPGHDRRNREWIAATRGLTERYGGCLFPRVARLLRHPWPADTIRVFATVYATWFGAYATSAHGPHATLSTNALGNLETYALESTLHESVHAAQLTHTLDSTIARSAARLGKEPVPVLSHAILFYTAGEVINDVIPTHIPYAERFGFWERTAASKQMRATLDRYWRPYVQGTVGFDDAVERLVEAIAP